MSYSETYVVAPLRTGLAPTILPNGLLPEVAGVTGNGTYTNARARGILYETANPGTSGYLRYYLIGTGADCTPGYRHIPSLGSDTMTVCRLNLD